MGTIRAEIAVATPAEVAMTMTITMTLKDWIELRNALPVSDHWHPVQQLHRAVDELTRKACKSFDFYGDAPPAGEQPNDPAA